MNLIFFTVGGMIGGFLSGFVFAWISDVTNKTHGVLDIDHNTCLCQVRLTSEEIKNRKLKKAVLKINHNAKLSRDEQIL